MNWFLLCVKEKYADFSGRAHRSEYWYFVLVYLIIAIVLSLLEGMLGMSGILSTLFALAMLLPSLAVGVRRLHDTGRTGWWLLIGLIPLIGFIVLIVFFVMDSEPGANQYGGNPKGAAA